MKLRYWFIVGTLAFIFGLVGGAAFASSEFTFARGTLNATDTEASECMVSVGVGPDALTVVAHPANMVCKRFIELKGRHGRLVFVVEETE
jgi:hypothetical protein